MKMDVHKRISGNTPEQMRARARAHMISKQVVIELATNVLNITYQDAIRIHSSVDMDLPEGLRANTASQCLAPLELVLGGVIALAYNKGLGSGTMVLAMMHYADL